MHFRDDSKVIAERRALFKQFDDLLQSIRSLEGFENFLRGPSESELRHLAEDGPIIVFNVSDIRSDAFIITTNEIHSIRLPLLTSNFLENYSKRFFDAINNEDLNRYRHAKVEMNIVLGWLWDVAVKPILDELGFTQMPCGDTWPKVWWIGSGLLSILPIHAAGYHDSTPPSSSLDRVISSYAPTVKSLLYAREKVVPNSAVKESAILVATPSTLPYAETETEELRQYFSKMSICTTVMKNQVVEKVLCELPKDAIVHFACHGYVEDDPSQSRLILEDASV